jgi:predicted RNA methylase
MPFSAGIVLAVLLAGLQLPARTPDIHFTPTRQNIADAMLRLANVTADDVVYDLGSGDGRIPIMAAQKYGARGIGIELDPRLVELSWRIANEGEIANRVKFIVGDLFDADLSAATVVTMYLSPSIM